MGRALTTATVTPPGCARSRRAAPELDLGDEAVNVFRCDAVRDHGARKLALEVEMHAVLGAGADELLDEVHPAAGLDPAVVSVDVVGFEQHFEFQEDRAV